MRQNTRKNLVLAPRHPRAPLAPHGTPGQVPGSRHPKKEQVGGGVLHCTISYSRSPKEGLVMADAEGNLPQWKACMVHSSTDWLKSGGEMCTTIDMSALSKWEYKQSESQEDENV